MRKFPANTLNRLRAAGLTETEGNCLGLYCFDGLRQRQIAKDLRMSQPAVSQHIAHARKKLRAAGLYARRRRGERGVVAMPNGWLDRLDPEQIKGIW